MHWISVGSDGFFFTVTLQMNCVLLMTGLDSQEVRRESGLKMGCVMSLSNNQQVLHERCSFQQSYKMIIHTLKTLHYFVLQLCVSAVVVTV